VSGSSATDSGRSGNSGQAVVKEIPREEVLSADQPVVYEAIVDAEVPPMPPHISFDQAKSITRALYRGDPAAADILRHSFAELVEEYIPHR
jgi:pyruvate dehydrogenase (quinone)